jgi:hypothetical protein
MDLLEVPYSRPVAASTLDAATAYTHVLRFTHQLEQDPSFTPHTLPYQLVSVAVELDSNLLSHTEDVPYGSVVIFEVYENAMKGAEAIETVLIPALNEEFADITQLFNYELLGFISNPVTGAFSPELTFPEIRVWPLLEDSGRDYFDLMQELIPDDPPDGLAIHLAYNDDGQMVVINVWQDQDTGADFHKNRFMPLWKSITGLSSEPELVPAVCLSLAADAFVHYTAAVAL